MREKFSDYLFDRLWDRLVSQCPQLQDLALPELWEQEAAALFSGPKSADDKMVGIRILSGLGCISRTFFELPSVEQTAIVDHFVQHFSKNQQVFALPSLVFEMQVYCRLAAAQMRPQFIPTKRKRKTPDLHVPAYNLLIECKNLSPQDFAKASLEKMCADIRQHSEKACWQFADYDPNIDARHLVILHLPPDLRGFFVSKHIGERVKLMLAASRSADHGYEGCPGSVDALFVETSLSNLYDRDTPVGQPTEYWHVPPPPTGQDLTQLRFLWELFMSMRVCPFEGYSSPLRLLNLYLHGQSASERLQMNPDLALQYWRNWNSRTGCRFDEFEIPPVPAFPQP